MKILKMLFIHAGFIFIIFGISIICIDQVSATIRNYYDDLEKSKEIIKNVDEQYKIFKDGATNVKESIDVVSSSFNFYLDDFENENSKIMKNISNVEEEIEKLNITASALINNCNYDLNNSFMDNQCSSFKINYKNMISSYEEMIKQYNSVIDYYNEYAIKNDKETVDSYTNQLSDNVKEILDKNI